jgi:hypothetical protein
MEKKMAQDAFHEAKEAGKYESFSSTHQLSTRRMTGVCTQDESTRKAAELDGLLK